MLLGAIERHHAAGTQQVQTRYQAGEQYHLGKRIWRRQYGAMS
jgi:hypothetical protein